jgi:C-terminal processing protease CtpA/Prc
VNRNRVFSKMAMFFGASSFLFFGALAFHFIERAGLKVAFDSICSRVANEYVKNEEPRARAFVQLCFQDANREVTRAMSGEFGSDSRRALIYLANERLSALRVSHLAAYVPDETNSMWTGESVDTGARARLVDGEVVVTRTIPRSPAARAGVRVGDLVVAVEGVPVPDAFDLEHMTGVWEILRPDETRVFLPVEAEVVQDRITPYWLTSQERPGFRVLRVPSFLPQAFDDDEWPRIRDEINDLHRRGEKLIVDIRGNQGGSFPAMLRVLGALKCDRSLVGWIYRGTPPRLEKSAIGDFHSYEMIDALDAEPQLDLLKKNGAIALVPFQKGPCFEGPVGVLIDQGTGSVAEIFAQAMKERPRTTIGGWRSSGHVVMARWFQIAGLSPDYTVSIPVALYRSAKGEELESRGVSPDQLLTDNLKRWRSSRDPWIADLMRAVSL